jgi:predicted small lipoprotein YifL
MQPKRLAGMLVVTAILLAACGKKGPSYTKYIPKDASYVVALDVKEMSSKLEKDSLTVENLLAVLKDSSNPGKYSEAITIWKQFKDAGIDLESKVFFAVPSFDFNSGDISVEVVGGLKDAKKLEEFIAKMPEAPQVKKDKDFSYAEKENLIVGWNSEAVIIVAGGRTPGMANFNPDDNTTAAPVPGATGSSLDKLKKYFSLSKDASIMSLKEFEELVGKKADVAIFSNSTNFANSGAGMAFAAMPKVKALLEGIYSTSTINFEDGKVVMDGNTYIGKTLGDTLKKYAGPEVDMALIDPYPSNNVNGVTAFSFNPKLLSAILELSGFGGIAEIGLSQQGLSSNDITSAFKGDFAVMFSDFTINKVQKKGFEGEPYEAQEPNAKLLVAIRIGDQAAFDKLIGMGEKMQLFKKQGNRLLIPEVGADSPKFSVGIENGLLIVSTDEATYTAYVAKTAKIGISAEARTAIKGNAMAMYFDVEKILQGIPVTILDPSDTHEKNILDKSKATFKTLLFTGSNFDGKKVNGKGEMTFVSNKNSLSQLVGYLKYVAEEMKQKDAEREASYKDEDLLIDSTAPAIDAPVK